jgi:hypothetical protein
MMRSHARVAPVQRFAGTCGGRTVRPWPSCTSAAPALAWALAALLAAPPAAPSPQMSDPDPAPPLHTGGIEYAGFNRDNDRYIR